MSTSNQKRRSFIGNSLFAVGALLFSKTETRAASNKTITQGLANANSGVFACESGNLGKDEAFAVGILKVNDITAFEAKMVALRQEHNYKTRLSYGSNDQYKLAFAKAAIDWLFETNNASFQIKVYSGNVPNANKESKHAASDWQLLEKKQDIYAELLKKANIQNEVVYVKYQSPIGPSVMYGKQFFGKTNCTYQAQDTRQSNALQLASLLSGTALAAFQGKSVHTVKQEIIDHLTTKLGGQSMKPNTRWNDTFIFQR